MRRAAIVILLAALSACAEPRPEAGVAVGTGGASANAGVNAGRVSAGVSTSGPYARADVVKTESVRASIGTGGAAVSVGAGPVSVGVGYGGIAWGLGRWF